MQNNGNIVLEVPVHLKSLADAFVAFMQDIESVRAKNAIGGGAVDYAAIEARYAEHSARMEKEAHGATLVSLDVDADRVEIRGELHYSVGRFLATFYTMAGSITVMRTLFRPAGIRNAPTVDPIALRIGAVEDYWLPGTAKAIAFLVQQGTSREAEQVGHETHRLPYSRPSMERIAHAVGKIVVGQQADIHDKLIGEVEIPPQAASMSISVDRASVPMEEPRPRPKGRPRKNAPKKPVKRVYHMAYCATITINDSTGAALLTIRYGWMPATDREAIADRLARDVLWIGMRAPHLKFVLLGDGAEDVWSILTKYINKEMMGIDPARLVDFWHVIEKLSAAAGVLFADQKERHQRREIWKRLLRRSSSAVETILSELKGSGKERVKVGDDCPVHDAITYLENHREMMDYARARGAGLPIGSGNVEATCKTLIGIRMKRAGSRWKEPTGQHVLTMRALGTSDLWDPALTIALSALRTAVVPVRKRVVA